MSGAEVELVLAPSCCGSGVGNKLSSACAGGGLVGVRCCLGVRLASRGLAVVCELKDNFSLDVQALDRRLAVHLNVSSDIAAELYMHSNNTKPKLDIVCTDLH